MARQRVQIGTAWVKIADGPVTLTIAKGLKGALWVNTSASDLNAVKYGPSELAAGDVVSQVDNLATYLKADYADSWEVDSALPGDGRLLMRAPDPSTGSGAFGAVETQLSAYASRGAADSFGKARVSQATTLFDAKMTYDIPEDYDQLTENGATITYLPDVSGAQIAVPATAGARGVIQQAQYSLYQPGDGHDVRATYGSISLAGACEFRCGYFDDENGVFVRYLAGGQVSLVLRSAITGSPVDQVVPQASWNIDPMDGTGPSGLTLDGDARQIFAPDLEWLSVGTVQYGFFIDRVFHPVHSIDHANTDGAAYMTTADLPVRWELIGDGVNTATVVAECCVVQTAGVARPAGRDFAVESDLTSVGTAETFIMALRPKTTYKGKPNHVQIQLSEVGGVSFTETIVLNIRYNTTLDSVGFADVDAESATEVSKTATWTPGSGRKIRALLIVAAGGGQGRPGQAGAGLQGKPPFTLHLDGSVDNIVITGRVIDGAGTSNAYVTAQLIERQ